MIRKVSISTLLLIGLFSTVAHAQHAQATMRVSVRVASGSSVELSQPLAVILKSDRKSSLGMLTLRGITKENVLISSSTKVKLSDANGNQAVLKVNSTQERTGQNEQHIRYEGISEGRIVSSIYKGELTTTIEYF